MSIFKEAWEASLSAAAAGAAMRYQEAQERELRLQNSWRKWFISPPSLSQVINDSISGAILIYPIALYLIWRNPDG